MNNGLVFNPREIRDSLDVAEQLARAAIVRKKTAVFSQDSQEKDSVAQCHDFAYVPPKQLLLYLVRMGSFTLAPKTTIDSDEDSDIDFDRMKENFGNLLEMCRFQLRGLPPLLKRSFVSVNQKAGPTFRLFQWNVLSQSLGEHHDDFICCPPEAMKWNTRRFRMLEEILEYDPDIICLQEVDHYNFLASALQHQGFSGTFFPKPDSPCIYIKGNSGPDGCAIFFREEKFTLIRIETRILEVWRVQSNQVVVSAVLRHKETDLEICVATTHLKARHGALLSVLRNEQGKDLVEFVEKAADGRPTIICGDFNAEPQEPVYSTMLGDRLNLSSAYSTLTGEEPEYTTWKVRGEGEVCHTIDYVFYTARHLQVRQMLQFPDEEEIGPCRIPSFQYPSDHFSLVVDFSLN